MWWVLAFHWILLQLGNAFVRCSRSMLWLARQTLRGIERLNEFVDEAPDA